MPIDVQDLRSTIIPKSDQLNSEQLLAGPIIITVSEVRVGGGEDQPVSIFYATDPGRPYKPCKTMRKVLILAWGADGTQWVGKSMELYSEPSVKFGGEVVGGIRISRLSDIPKDIKVSLTATKGRKAMHEIKPLSASPELTAALAAITAATNSEGMKKAKALAEKLTADADIAFALAAYKKKVEQLKKRGPEAPPPTPSAFDAVDDDSAAAGNHIDAADRPDAGADPGQAQGHGQQPAGGANGGGPVVTYAALAGRLQNTADRDVALLVLDEGRGLPSKQRKELQAVFDERFPE